MKGGKGVGMLVSVVAKEEGCLGDIEFYDLIQRWENSAREYGYEMSVVEVSKDSPYQWSVTFTPISKEPKAKPCPVCQAIEEEVERHV